MREAGNPISAEVGDDDRADEELEDQQELALLNQVGLARLVDQLGDVGHRPVHRQALDAGVGPRAEEQAEHADHQARQQDLVPGHAEEVALVEVGQVDVHLAAGHVLRGGAAAAGGGGCAAPGVRPAQDASASAERDREPDRQIAAPVVRSSDRQIRVSSCCSYGSTHAGSAAPCRRSERSGCLPRPTDRESSPARADRRTTSPRYR